MPEVIFLDESLRSRFHIWKPLISSSKPLHVASSLLGVRRFEQLQNSEDKTLLLWIDDRAQLSALASLNSRPNLEYLFVSQKIRPSEIVGLGDFKGPQSTELPNFSILDPDFLSPQIKILQKAQIATPLISVIIPAYDNAERLRQSLNSWLLQNYNNYEIVLIDDGSPTPILENMVGLDPAHLTLIRLQRSTLRQRGDFQFRAGIARNAGLENSRGSFVIFCDSDILVPLQTLPMIEEELNQYDVVMPQRWQLNQSKSKAPKVLTSDIDFNSDVTLTPGAFWESFQTDSLDWSTKEHFWKWTSTFFLATHRKFLEKHGAFKKSFNTYGFEDTELGYRFYRAGCRFHLSQLKTFHLFQDKSHSEYGNESQKKMNLLKISADRFFRHHPNKEVYQALRNWLD